MVVQSHDRYALVNTILKLKHLTNTTVKIFMTTASNIINKFVYLIPQICNAKAKDFLVIYIDNSRSNASYIFSWKLQQTRVQ